MRCRGKWRPDYPPPDGQLLRDAGHHGTSYEHFAEAWGLNEAAADLIQTALILAADHELKASAFTVRCVASTHATPYDAINPGLCALQGPRHGGQTAQAIAHIDDISTAPSASDANMARLKRGERLPGFGMPFYPGLGAQSGCYSIRVEENFGWIPPSISQTISFRRREMPSVSVPISTLPWPQCAARFRYQKQDRSPSSPLAAAPVGSLMRRSNTRRPY